MAVSVRPIVVVGSANIDLMLRVPKLPRPGETLVGQGFVTQPGGKGANQAIAAARQGAPVAFVGCVGADTFGEQARRALLADAVDVRHLRQADDLPTGVAMITTDDAGENCIALDPGANLALSIADLDAAADLIAGASMLICQLEVPLEAVRHGLALARAHGVPALLNPSPAVRLPPDCYERLDYLVPNRSEAAALTGIATDDLQGARAAAMQLRRCGVAEVLLTLGADGVMWCGPHGCRHLTAPIVRPVDTAGAGDTFAGAFAAARWRGLAMDEAIGQAQRAAAFSVQRRGAQASMPRLADLNG